jgi:restriction endonuclease S subunit
LQKTQGESEHSWTLNVNDLGDDYSLEVKNPNKVQEVDERLPQEIFESIITISKEISVEIEVLKKTINEEMNPKQGWNYKKLGEVSTFARGLTYSKKDEVESSTNIVLRSNNIDLLSGKLVFSELKYLNNDFEIPTDKRVKKGSLFICMSNGSKAHLGKVAYIDKDYQYAFGGFMGLITPTKEVDGLYLYYALSSPSYKDYIKSLSEGANINNLKFKDLSDFVIYYPSLAEQQAIVARLDLAFAKIDALKANAERKLAECDALKQAILRQVFE